MPVLNRIAACQPEMVNWRRDFHAHPELLYDVHRTATRVAEKLKAFGCDEVVTGVARTGVVGVIRGAKPAGSGSRATIGLRADMDALPIGETSHLPYKSTVSGRMHACGHDGHTTMLLGAAKYLAETRNFAGTAVVVFQPAEEGGGGAKEMIEQGLMERFGVDEIYAIHNMPGLPVGEFAIRPGPITAAAHKIFIDIEGKASHAAEPHKGIDTILVGAEMITQLQSIVARNLDPLESAVISICTFEAGTAQNIIAPAARLTGTARTLTPEVAKLVERRLHEIVEGTARLHGATATLSYRSDTPVTYNHERQTAFAAGVAGEVAGAGKVNTTIAPIMGGEDFSFMLEARPGAFIFMGNGMSAGLHHPAYDFNDDAIPVGASYFARLVETAMAA